MHKIGSVKAHYAKRKLSKRHCEEDVACLHCCSCWQKFKVSYEVRNRNLEKQNSKLKEEVKFLKELNLQLVKKLNAAEALNKEQLQLIEKMGEELRQKNKEGEQEEEPKKNQREEELEQLVSELQNNLMEKQSKIDELSLKLLKLVEEVEILKLDNDSNIRELAEKVEEIEEHKKRIKDLTTVVDSKKNSFQLLKANFDDIESKFMIERAKSKSLVHQKQTLGRNLKSKDDFISVLTKRTQENAFQMNNMERGNKKLAQLVNSLGIKRVADRFNEEYLKERLINTEDKLFVTEEMAYLNNRKAMALQDDLLTMKMNL